MPSKNMNNENDEEIISITQEVEVEPNTTEADENAEESVDEIKEKLAKAEELANNYKIRAEKAEKRKTETVEIKTTTKKSDDLSGKDIYALQEAKVPLDDIDDVREYANMKKISIQEALKSPVVKVILSNKADERNTAQATHTGTSTRGSTKVTDESLMNKADKGDLPDSEADMARLFKARRGIK